jgi:spore maturation protein CgeB
MVCWEIDHNIDIPHPINGKNDTAHVFTYRKKNRKEFISAGFDHVTYLPMATDIQKRTPLKLSRADKDRYSAPIAFVGNTLLKQARDYRKTLTHIYRCYCQDVRIPYDDTIDPFEDILAAQGRDQTAYQIDMLLESRLKDFKDYFRQRVDPYIDPSKLLAETAAARKRLIYVSGLGEWGVKIWGDAGWKEIEGNGITYMGLAGHHHEINKIYAAAQINVEVNRIYQPEIVTMRIFDVMACGGFLIAEHADDMEDLFDIGREIVTYRTLDDLLDKVAYYLKHPAEAGSIASAGRRAVHGRHTIKMRIDHMLSAIHDGDRGEGQFELPGE